MMVYSLDVSIFHFLNGFAGKSHLLDLVITFLASYLPYVVILVLIIFLLRNYDSKKQVLITTALSALISRFVVAEVIRYFYHRPRPFIAMHVTQLVKESNWSFPSGHASFFFALAGAVYFYNKKWGIGFLIAAFFIGVGRVMAGVHYPSDILGGAIVGIAVSYIVFKTTRRYLK